MVKGGEIEQSDPTIIHYFVAVRLIAGAWRCQPPQSLVTHAALIRDDMPFLIRLLLMIHSVVFQFANLSHESLKGVFKGSERKEGYDG